MEILTIFAFLSIYSASQTLAFDLVSANRIKAATLKDFGGVLLLRFNRTENCYLKKTIEQISETEIKSNDEGANFQWYNCTSNSILKDSVGNGLFPSDTGIYAIILTKNGCIDTSNCILFEPLRLYENTLQNQITLFPNPTLGNFNLNGLNKQDSYQVQIRNIQGQLIQEESHANQNQITLNLKGNSGIYFIQLINEKGERANFKVVKR